MTQEASAVVAQNEVVVEEKANGVPLSHWLSYAAFGLTVVGLVVSCIVHTV